MRDNCVTTQTLQRPKQAASYKRMVRKQIYIYRRQNEQLKCLAQQRETTEAELIRQAIEVLLTQPGTAAQFLPLNEEAWQTLLHSMQAQRASDLTGEPHRWTRADYYDDERSQRLAGNLA
jgi:hypothetical protein